MVGTCLASPPTPVQAPSHVSLLLPPLPGAVVGREGGDGGDGDDGVRGDDEEENCNGTDGGAPTSMIVLGVMRNSAHCKGCDCDDGGGAPGDAPTTIAGGKNASGPESKAAVHHTRPLWKGEGDNASDGDGAGGPGRTRGMRPRKTTPAPPRTARVSFSVSLCCCCCFDAGP